MPMRNAHKLHRNGFNLFWIACPTCWPSAGYETSGNRARSRRRKNQRLTLSNLGRRGSSTTCLLPVPTNTITAKRGKPLYARENQHRNEQANWSAGVRVIG